MQEISPETIHDSLHQRGSGMRHFAVVGHLSKIKEHMKFNIRGNKLTSK